MKKQNILENELLEFFVLGFVLFIVIFGIFSARLMVFQSSLNVFYKDISLPNEGLKKIQAPKVLKSRPSITTIDDSNTPCNYNDDVVNYNTSVYSIVLPYNLAFYTKRKGANKALKRLVEAHEQLHRQLLKNNTIKTDYQNESYNQMLVILKQIQRSQDEVYLLINKKKFDKKIKQKYKLSFKIDDLKSANSRLYSSSRNVYDVIFSNPDSENLLPFDEAVIIIDQLNNHIVMLNNKAVADYYTVIYRKGFDIKTFKKPEITNIIERLEYRLKKKNEMK